MINLRVCTPLRSQRVITHCTLHIVHPALHLCVRDIPYDQYGLSMACLLNQDGSQSLILGGFRKHKAGTLRPKFPV
jgi:hypothetical protein